MSSDKARWSALNILCLGVLMIVLDATIANVALPKIQEDLGFSDSSKAWVINSYMIAFGGFLLLSGRLGDLIGRRTIFIAGLVVFTVASVLCGLSNSQEMLVASRFLQGAGGAMSQAVALGIVVTLFPSPADRARALGRFAFVASAGGSVGLVAGGFITQWDWHWIFFINLPIGVISTYYALRLLDADEGIGLDKGMDIPGAALITGSLMLGVFTIVNTVPKEGWTAGKSLGLLGLAVAMLVLFVVREATAKTPLMPLSIFKSRIIAASNVVQALAVAGMFSMFFIGTFYLQSVLDYNPRETGLAFLPATLLMGVLSWRYSERIVMRFGALNCLVAGLALLIGALLWYAQAPVDGVYLTDVLPVMVLFGLGGGICFPALMNLAMHGATPKDAGLVSGLIGTSMQIGGAVGLAVLATLSADRTKDLVRDGMSQLEALNEGYHYAYYISACLITASLVCALAFLRMKPTAGHPHPDADWEMPSDEVEPAPVEQ